MSSLTECPACQEPVPVDANWCEACGNELGAADGPTCVACGNRNIASDGYCMACGQKQPAERDHQELAAGPVKAVTDRGRRHHHNEDAVALGELPGGGAVLVVCDGVSSTPGSADASLAAASAARDLLVERLGTGTGDGTATGDGTGTDGAGTDGTDVAERGRRALEALVEAAAAAQAGAAAVPEQVSSAPYAHGGPPSSTFVAAVGQPIDGFTHLWVAWLGDSRAYWVDDGGAMPLTEDHEIGGSLIRWLGADSLDHLPDLTSYSTDRPGWLLVCSDGLWRYAEPAGELAELVRRCAVEHPSTMALAGALVDHAIASGGHDNVTVALWPSMPDGPGAAGAGQDPEQAESEPADE